MAPNPAPAGARRRARLAGERLAWVHPARGEIEFRTPFQLLVATVLSPLSAGRKANRLAAQLVARYPTPQALAEAGCAEVERILCPAGFLRARSALVRTSRLLVERHGGRVPTSPQELLALPGIGVKGANTIVGTAFGAPAIIADRHLIRVARRLRLVSAVCPEEVESQLRRLLPRRTWATFSLRMAAHGRRVCRARRPLCSCCVLNDFCPTSATAGWPVQRRRWLVLELRQAATA